MVRGRSIGGIPTENQNLQRPKNTRPIGKSSWGLHTPCNLWHGVQTILNGFTRTALSITDKILFKNFSTSERINRKSKMVCFDMYSVESCSILRGLSLKRVFSRFSFQFQMRRSKTSGRSEDARSILPKVEPFTSRL